jgi:hypothetical protein
LALLLPVLLFIAFVLCIRVRCARSVVRLVHISPVASRLAAVSSPWCCPCSSAGAVACGRFGMGIRCGCSSSLSCSLLRGVGPLWLLLVAVSSRRRRCVSCSSAPSCLFARSCAGNRIMPGARMAAVLAVFVLLPSLQHAHTDPFAASCDPSFLSPCTPLHCCVIAPEYPCRCDYPSAPP